MNFLLSVERIFYSTRDFLRISELFCLTQKPDVYQGKLNKTSIEYKLIDIVFFSCKDMISFSGKKSLYIGVF